MSFLRTLFGSKKLDGPALARSDEKSEYAQIELLSLFRAARAVHEPLEQQRWTRVLPRGYADTLALFVKEGWLEQSGDLYHVTDGGRPAIEAYAQRVEQDKTQVMPHVLSALQVRDTSEALEIRRRYEAQQPLGNAQWTGPDPQMSHSALTRRILFLDNWLLDGLSEGAAEWLKLYAAEQHMWGTYWRLSPEEIPEPVRSDLKPVAGDSVAETAYWKAYGLALYVDNQETWQRCKGGDHVRRIEISGPDDAQTCDHCRSILGEQYLVARVPALPHRECSSPLGCRCRYEPVLEMYENL